MPWYFQFSILYVGLVFTSRASASLLDDACANSVETGLTATKSTWLGYSPSLFGGFFNVTVESNSIQPFGKCVQTSGSFGLIERVDAVNSQRCLRCIFVEDKTPSVVQIRMTGLHCQALDGSESPDTSETLLLRICSLLSPSQPLLTLLKSNLLSLENNVGLCPLLSTSQAYNVIHRGDIPKLDCSTPANACMDLNQVFIACSDSILPVKCLSSWKSDVSSTSSFSIVQFGESVQLSSIRCVHLVQVGDLSEIVATVGSTFDCSDVSTPHSKRNQLKFLPKSKSSLIAPSQVFSEEAKEVEIIDTADSPSCTLPWFLVSGSRRWLSIGRSSHGRQTSTELLLLGDSTFRLANFKHEPHGERRRYLGAYEFDCAELEIWDQQKTNSSRMYQAVFRVRDVVVSSAEELSTSTEAPEGSTATTVAQNASPCQAAGIIPSRKRRKVTASFSTYFRCVKFYQRDQTAGLVLEMLLGTETVGTAQLACAAATPTSNRFVLIDSSILPRKHHNSAASRQTCLSTGPNVAPVQVPSKQPVEDSNERTSCLTSQLCHSRHGGHDSSSFLLLVRPRWSNYDDEASESVQPKCVPSESGSTNFFDVHYCLHRWQRDYISDNLLAIDSDGEEPSISCFILRHNGLVDYSTSLLDFMSPLMQIYQNVNCSFTSSSEAFETSAANDEVLPAGNFEAVRIGHVGEICKIFKNQTDSTSNVNSSNNSTSKSFPWQQYLSRPAGNLRTGGSPSGRTATSTASPNHRTSQPPLLLASIFIVVLFNIDFSHHLLSV